MSHEFDALYYVYDAGFRWGPPDLVYIEPLGLQPYVPAKMGRRRPTEVPSITREDLIGKFGMGEMESAALIIMQKAHRLGTYDICVTLADFAGDECAVTGFLNLLNYGARAYCASMLIPAHVNPSAHGEFKPSAEFYDRIVGEAIPSAGEP